MVKLLIFAALIYFGYRKLKSFVNPTDDRLSGAKPPEAVTDVMIQDPVCKTYVVKRDAIHLQQGGVDYYFCSEKCRDRFVSGFSE